MKGKRIPVYVLFVAGILACAGGAVWAFIARQTVVGAVLTVAAVFALLFFTAMLLQDAFVDRCNALFAAGKYEEERALLDRAHAHHLLFPLMRAAYYPLALVNAAARDDMAAAEHYIDHLRHGTDAGARYQTAYLHILALLDRGERESAQAEYEDFRTNNGHAHVYKEQLEILHAVFARLSGSYGEPLPESVSSSRFPVVARILGRHFEARAQEQEIAYE